MTSHHDTIELDSRTTDGIEVRLLWHQAENRVTVTARDERSGEVLEVTVRHGENALDVFHHPYAYAAFHGVEARSHTRLSAPTLSH
jgi:YD repeat-containing protein